MVETNKTSENLRVKELIGLIGKIALEDLKIRRKKTDKNDPMNAIVGAVKNLQNEFKTFEKNEDLAEKLSLESTEILDSLLNHTPAGIAILAGPELRYFRVNQNLADLNGLPVEDHLGKPLKEVLPDARETLLPIMRKIMKDGKAVLGREFSITLPKNPDKPVHLIDYLFPIPDEHGKPFGIGAIVLNISERKEAEDSLKKSEKRFRAIFESSPHALFIHDLKGILIEVNDTACKLHGHNRKDLIGMSVFDLAPIELKKEVKENIQKLLKEESIHVEGYSLKKDGTRVAVEVRGVKIQYGEKPALLYEVSDISIRKSLEEERERLNEKLKQAEKMESLGILAGGVAHDLNNTFVPILALPDIILSKRPDDSELKEELNLIKNATERAAGIVGDLLTLARRGRYEMAPLNLNNLLNEFFKSPAFIGLQDRYPNVTFENDLSKDMANIKGSEAHLTQVVMNLVKNAYESMEHGGKLKIKTSNRSLPTTLKAYTDISAGDYVLLEIIDNGTGIKDEDLRKIFEPFYTQKELGTSGSGLGLAVVWGVVKDHEAFIDVGTAFGSGAKFSIYFPSTDEIEEDVSEEKIDISGTEKILIVDDVKVQLEALDVILSSLGYHVDAVMNGHLAVEFLEKNDVDLVVLDMLLEEGFDGLDTYKEIKKIKPNQKAIIVSGFSETERVQHAMLYGVGKFVSKPYSVEKIGKAVREELDKK